MGNYKNLESEFINRTLSLIDQYYDVLDNYPFEEQFNYTLTINCLLGLIVMPKERVISFIPTVRLTSTLLNEVGAPSLKVGGNIRTLRDLIESLRHSVAHFDIEVISENERNQIDWLVFSNSQNEDSLVAKFRSNELRQFLIYYAQSLLQNMVQHRT